MGPARRRQRSPAPRPAQPGRPVRRPTTLASTGVGDGPGLSEPTLAWSSRGDLVVAFQRRTGLGLQAQEVAARVKRHGHGFGAIEHLTRSRGWADITAAVAPDGRVAVAWGTQDLGEEANTPFQVGAAIRRPGAHPFGRAQTLDAGGADRRSLGRVALTLAADGTATVAWSSVRSGADPIRSASAPGHRTRFTAVRDLGQQGGVAGLATNAAGVSVLVWTGRDTGRLMAAISPGAGAPFGAAESVSSPDRVVQGASAAVAFDPGNGPPLVVWPQEDRTLPDAVTIGSSERP